MNVRKALLHFSQTCKLVPRLYKHFFPVEHELWWPKRVCAAKQMIFGVLRHKVLIYDFHMFKTSKFIIPS